MEKLQVELAALRESAAKESIDGGEVEGHSALETECVHVHGLMILWEAGCDKCL